MKRLYILFAFVCLGIFSSNAQNCNYICNESFENPTISSPPYFATDSLIPCWKTTAFDGKMELWNSGYNGVSAFSGNQFLEMNAFHVSTIFQNIVVNPGIILSIGFAHRGRAGIDTMSVSIGTAGAADTVIGTFADDTLWGYYTVNYTVPLGSNNYSIKFNSVYAALNDSGIGNFLDSITVCALNIGLDEKQNENAISIFPNPFENTLNINSVSQEGDIVILYDVMSRRILERKIKGDLKVNTTFLKNGIYFYQIVKNNRVVDKGKLIKT